MDDIVIAAMAVLIAATISLAIVVQLARSDRGRSVTAAVTAAQALLLFGTAGHLWLMRSNQPPASPGSVSITAGTGRTGCVVDIAGVAEVPRGRDLWLFLAGDDDVYYAQGGKPVREGPATGSWSFLRARVANEFFENAHYRWVAVIVSQSTSGQLREAIGDGDDGWPLPHDAFPHDEQVTARASGDLLLTSETGCG
jgi:hypothetical protein